MSKPLAKKKITRRRDGDPVRISANFVVSWYPGGVPGNGHKRLQKRTKDAAAAREFADQKYAEIARHTAVGPLGHVAFGELWRHFVTFLLNTNTPQGTSDQYRSNWRCHVPEAVGDVSCADLDVSHWTRIFEEMLMDGATKETMHAVSRTLGALINYAENRNYFGSREAFGVSARRRGKIVAELAQKAPAAADQVPIGTDHCPAPALVHRFAEAAEQTLPGYGFLLVLLAFASGLRFTECLGLRIEHINLLTGEIRVEQQLNRYRAWPAVAPPKGGRSRTVQIWVAYNWVLRRLVEQAATHDGEHVGWLFPPDRPVKRWADRANRLVNQEAVELLNEELRDLAVPGVPPSEWTWTFHWLRHAFASYGLASRDHGGLGFSVPYVQKQLGHRKPSTTTDQYQTPIGAEGEHARQLSATLPWEVSQVSGGTTSRSTNEVA
ncbi:MAG TPA: tyrosine-type recombinase/integrase [Pedococcus sp.]|jgi:integrase|nr:tyrosine-type recombinase/integrase [Pedococcus sp.]